MGRDALIERLKKEEGFIEVAKWDLKQFSYGYGCKAPYAGAIISEPEAAKLVSNKVDECYDAFNKIFFGHINKFNEVREDAFVDMIYNMGPGKKGDPARGGLQSFVHALGFIFNNDIVPWGKVANELKNSKWYGQVGARAERIVNEVKTGVKAV